jgi:hypothetical protein
LILKTSLSGRGHAIDNGVTARQEQSSNFICRELPVFMGMHSIHILALHLLHMGPLYAKPLCLQGIARLI